MELEDTINITYGTLAYIFQILDTENVAVTLIIPCLAILSQKKVKMILPTSKKPHNFVRETTNYLKKPSNDLEEKKKKKQLGMWVSLPKSRYHRIYFRKLFQF